MNARRIYICQHPYRSRFNLVYKNSKRLNSVLSVSSIGVSHVAVGSRNIWENKYRINQNSINASCSFSTGSINADTKRVKVDAQFILAKTLYREILRWCKSTSYEVPFDPIPPVSIAPPRIDKDTLQQVALIRQSNSNLKSTPHRQYTNVYNHINDILPPNTVLGSDGRMITVPVHDAADLRNFIRAVYKINIQTKDNADPNVIKERVSLGFEALKSLNELTESLERRKQKRASGMDRNGTLFKVGQVLQHKTDRWRGVVIGWKHIHNQVTSSTKTSLTQKQYPTLQDEDVPNNNKIDQSKSTMEKIEGDDRPTMMNPTIQYELLIDAGDAHLLGSRPYHEAQQSDLELVSDPSLCRIRSHWVQNKFDHFDSKTHSFIPGRTLAFEYPLDRTITSNMDQPNLSFNLKEELAKWNNHDKTDLKLLSNNITKDIQKIASQLEKIIIDATSCAKTSNPDIFLSMKRKLESIVSGNMTNTADKLSSPPRISSNGTSFQNSIQHLRGLLDVTIYIYDLMWHRQERAATEHKDRIQFELGSIVKHKVYGYRGVIVGWDPYPSVDVSRWDGLADIKGNVNEMPFYHVVPDTRDCIKIFGSERKFRYVCDANLDLCPDEEIGDIDLDLSLDHSEGWEMDHSGRQFMVPQNFKFKYAESLGDDDELVNSCMDQIMNNLTKIYLDIRGNSGCKESDGLTISNLFQLLQKTENLEDATVIEELIREIWKIHDNNSSRWKLENGIGNLLHGNKEKALSIFDELVSEDPTYFEAWNRKATCHYLLGDMHESCRAAEKVLELQPLHFQAFNGLGLGYYEAGEYLKSIEAFRQSIILDPWSPSSSKLSACLDLAHRLKSTKRESIVEKSSKPES